MVAQPPTFFEYLLSGLMLGVLYTVMATGITFIYGVMRMINWAMGEFYMIAGYIQLMYIRILGPQLWPLAVVLSAATVFSLGLLVQRGIIKPMFTRIGERKEDYATITTISLSVLLRNLMVVLFGPYVWSVPDYYPNVSLAGITLSGNRLLAALAGLGTLVVFFTILKFTWTGLALRATAQNRFSVQTVGVNVWSVDGYAFAIGVTLAAVAGIMLAPVFLIYPESGIVPTVKGFVIIVIGGLGSLMGSLAGGMLLGMSEAMGTAIIDPKYREVYGFIIMIIVLLLRPKGLFGRVEREV
ncbi:MAG: branched-chain amino acid ABC transporter permease [Candidatus Caldarchaeum sp.]